MNLTHTRHPHCMDTHDRFSSPSLFTLHVLLIGVALATPGWETDYLTVLPGHGYRISGTGMIPSMAATAHKGGDFRLSQRGERHGGFPGYQAFARRYWGSQQYELSRRPC